MQILFKFQVNRMKIDNFRIRPILGWPSGLCWPFDWRLTSKVISGWIQWPDMQILFKFQVNRMKFEDFRKFGSNWPIGLCRPFWSTKFYETSMRDCCRIGDINLWKFQNDRLSGLAWRQADAHAHAHAHKWRRSTYLSKIKIKIAN